MPYGKLTIEERTQEYEKVKETSKEIVKMMESIFSNAKPRKN